MNRISQATAALALVLGVTACAKSKDQPPKQEETAVNKQEPPAGATAPADAAPSAAAKDERPPPPPELYEGQGDVRVVNLWVDADGKTQPIEVWGKRHFKYGPVKLIERLEYGQATDWFKLPEGVSPGIFPVGAGPDGKELGGMMRAKEGERITSAVLFESGRPDSTVSIPSYWETSPDPKHDVPAPPAGKGLLVLRAGQLSAHKKALEAAGLGRSFFVGGGGDGCLARRGDNATTALGGTVSTLHDLPPGKTTITLHRFHQDKDCKAEPLHSFEVEIVAGEAQLVLVHTPDGKSLDTLVLPHGAE